MGIAKPETRIPKPRFDWRIYADATSAGLSVLIPLPVVDLVFERTFRRRIPTTIAKIRKSRVLPEVQKSLGRNLDYLWSLSGCLGIGMAAVKYGVRRIWRKIIYVFAVSDAATALTEYWHRAFLIDHMVRAGHLEPEADTDLALKVFGEVLRDVDPSPLMDLARMTVANVRRTGRLMVRARRMGAEEVTRSLGGLIAENWKTAESALAETARAYNQRYVAEVELRSADSRILTAEPGENRVQMQGQQES